MQKAVFGRLEALAVSRGDSKDHVAVDLVPGAEKSRASAVRIDAVIRIENLNGMGFRLDIFSSGYNDLQKCTGRAPRVR